MTFASTYTLAALAADDARFVERRPGVREIERMFPSPIAAGKGSVAIEGGVSIVGGPGIGKSSLLSQLAVHLDRDRGLTTAKVVFPRVADYADDEGFYPFLGQLVLRIRDSLLRAPRLADSALAPVAASLQPEPVWDGPSPLTMTPRGFERFIAPLAHAAQRSPGLCLLFDEVDAVGQAPWKGPFISGLRFVFQASTGITPIYALWTLFGDESLPGSNYFRNVTRPVFLEPLSAEWGMPGSRFELIARGLPNLTPPTQQRLSQLVGGHPLLLHKLLGDLAGFLVDESTQAEVAPEDIDVMLGQQLVADQEVFIADLLMRSAGLPAALRELSGNPRPIAHVMRGLLASGFVDQDERGLSVLPLRVAAALEAMR